jgi:hypothetical protein
MRGLKIATTLTLLGGVGLLLAWPVAVGPRPAADAGKRVLADYAVRLSVYFSITSLLFMATAILAYLIVRKTRIEFAEERLTNLHSLMEGTLNDHGPRSAPADDAARD